MKVSFAAAELVYRRLLSTPTFSDPERRLLELHLDNSFRVGQMVASYGSVEEIFTRAGIHQKHYYRTLHRLVLDGVLQQVSKVAYALIPEPTMWGFERRPQGVQKPLEMEAKLWNKQATINTPSAKQGEFFEWPTIGMGLQLSFLDAAMKEIYPPTGAGEHIPGAELPISGGSNDGLNSKACQRREAGTARNTTSKVVLDGPERLHRGLQYHPEGGIQPPQVGENSTVKVASRGNTTLKVVSADACKQTPQLSLTEAANAAIAGEANKTRQKLDTTAKVVCPEADKQRVKCANTTLRVVSEPRARARNVNVINEFGTNVERAKCRCSKETEKQLMEEIAAFLTAPGDKVLTFEQAVRELKNSGKFWRCWVVRLFPNALEIALGEGRDWVRTRKTFNKSRSAWLNYHVRLEAGLSSWSGIKPALQREQTTKTAKVIAG